MDLLVRPHIGDVLAVVRRRVPAGEARASPRREKVAARHIVQPLERVVALEPEERLVDLLVRPYLVRPYIGDVLAVVRRSVPAGEA